MGASYLRFELIEVKGQKQVVPVRYSIRNGSDQMQELLRQELLNSSNIGFLPCKQLEENFRLASAAQEIRALLLQRSQKVVEVDDIEEVLELDLCGYAIVELTEEASAAKFQARFVAVRLAEGVVEDDDEADVQEAVLSHLHELSHAQVADLRFVQASRATKRFLAA